ncbi:DNA recombination protein RecN [Amycolatopsis sp. Hca4]|nr:DNA recombination protein RecN [Amycolatopsis sp. Hca4]
MRPVRLRLRGVDIDYEVDFRVPDTPTPRSLSIIAGAFSTGKSSVLEFIDYCLGAREHPRHPEILRKVRAALLEVELSGQAHVIERSVGESSPAAFVRPGRLDDADKAVAERRLIRPPSDQHSLSSLLLSHCGLEGVQLREAPTQAASETDSMSFRDLMWLCYLPNERLADKNLLFENDRMKHLKLGQVVDVVFGVHDDAAIELGRRVTELERRLSQARVEHSAAQRFLDEQELGSRLQVEATLEQAERRLSSITALIADADNSVRAATSFAEELRTRHREASTRARQAAARVRDHETQLQRMTPLRAQYAADINKLTLLAQARSLFDPLRVQVCPACFSTLGAAPRLEDNRCSLCKQDVADSNQILTFGSNSNGDEINPASGTAGAEGPLLDVGIELRATRARLKEITAYVEALDSQLGPLRSLAAEAREVESRAARALDQATRETITPFLSQRDDLAAQREAATTELQQARASRRMFDGLDRRATDVTRLENNLTSLRAELTAATSTRPDRNNIIHLISQRFADILVSWRYPKIDQAFINDRLIPNMRGDSYRTASSGGRTLISLAWMLSIFEVAWESDAAHPGFLMIDSPQKNLGQGGERDAEFADTVAVGEFYHHLHRWLAGPGKGAQVIVVDNAPPQDQEADVVIRFSGRPDQPPYGLISDETM